MKLFVVAAILCVWLQAFDCEMKISDNRDVEAFARATNEILDKTVNEFKKVTIVIFAEKNKKHFDDVIEGLIKYSKGRIVNEIYRNDSEILKLKDKDGYIDPEALKGLYIFLYESLPLFVKEQLTITYLNGQDVNLLIAHVDQATAEEIRNVQKFESTENNSTVHPKLHFIVNAGRSFIDLIAIVKFTPHACHKVQATTINRYSKHAMAWEKQLERVTNDINFHNCTLCFYFSGDIKGATVKQEVNGTLSVKGALMEIIKEIEKYSNVKINLVNKKDTENFSCNSISVRPLTLLESDVAEFYQNELYFIVPRGEQLTEYEILLLAFDAATWYLIIATFGTAFAFIFIVKVFKATTVRNFVFGRNVSSPALNILVIFFGLSQVALPRRNFARFTLTLFIIWSLIIRTCYNGLLFEYLQSDKHHPGIQTIKQLMTKNLTYFVGDDFFALVEYESELSIKTNVSLSKVLREIYSNDELGTPNMATIINAYFEAPRNESVLIADTFQIIDFHKKNPYQTLLIMKETIMSFYGGILISGDYFSKSIIRSAISNLTENDIISHELSEMYESKFFNPQSEPKEPEVLTLSQLAVGFKLYGYCLGVIAVIWSAEIAIEKLRLFLRLVYLP